MKPLFDFSSFLGNLAIKTDTGVELTYYQLQKRSDAVKWHLLPNRLAFCLCTNTVSSLVGYVALIQQGVTTLLLDAYKDIELLERLKEIYRPNYIWAPKSEALEKYLYEDGDYCLTIHTDEPVEIFKGTALLLTTSGSTGSPKLVRLTQDNLRCNAESIAEYLKIDEQERPVTSLPMYYSYGMSVINSHFIKGATVFLTAKNVLERGFWDFVKAEGATSIAGVPYTYEMLKRLRFFRMDLPHLKTMIQAGGKLNADIVKEYVEFAKENNKEFIVMYGQTEAAPRMSYLPFEYASEKYASIGIAIPGGRFSLRDSEDRDISEPDIDGELIYEGENVCLGYAEVREDLAKGDENHGVLHTGDVARRDADGFYYITGRMKRFVKIWGNRCNLDAIEQLVKSLTTNCACIGEDDKITVFITEPSLADNVKDYLAKKTGFNVRAFDVKVINEIPKKESGKIDYSTLKSVFS